MLLTAQIHQGIRLSPLKVLVSLVFRPASNLLLRLLHICNNATFALLHSKRHVRSERLNRLRERCLNRAHLTEGASGRGQGRLRGVQKKGGLNLTTSHIRGYIENWSGRCSFWCRTTLRSNWKMSTTRRYLKLKTKIEKKNWKKKTGGNNHTRKVSWPCSVARRG